MSGDYRDVVIAELVDENAQLVDLVADLAWENSWLRVVADRAFRQPYQKRPARDLNGHPGRAAA
jgi:hypothetical protein